MTPNQIIRMCLNEIVACQEYFYTVSIQTETLGTVNRLPQELRQWGGPLSVIFRDANTALRALDELEADNPT